MNTGLVPIQIGVKMETITLTYNGRWDFVKTPKTFEFDGDTDIRKFINGIYHYIQEFGCRQAFASDFILRESVTNSVCSFESWNDMELFITELYELVYVREARKRFKNKATKVFEGLTDEELEKTYLFMVSIGACKNV